MTQRLFRAFPNFKVASMASARRHAAATPSPWPHGSRRVACESRDAVAAMASSRDHSDAVPHAGRQEPARCLGFSDEGD